MSRSSVVSRTVGLVTALAVALAVLWVLFAVLEWLSGPLTGLVFAALVVALALYALGTRL